MAEGRTEQDRDRWRRRRGDRSDSFPPRRSLAGLLFVAGFVLVNGCAPSGPESRSDATAPTETRSVILAWDAPERDAEGDPLEDLGGYRIYYAETSPVTRTGASMIELGEENTSHTVAGLSPGVWHFAVAAVDTSGNESTLSEELRADLR